jgi:hypothetical protein
LVLADKDGKGLEAISPMSFGADGLNAFLEALKEVQPTLNVTTA